MQYWYNITTGKVETDENRSQNDQVMGPYATEAEAEAALATARSRTEKWDEEDREWDDWGVGSGSAGGGSGAGGSSSGGSWSDADLED